MLCVENPVFTLVLHISYLHFIIIPSKVARESAADGQQRRQKALLVF